MHQSYLGYGEFVTYIRENLEEVLSHSSEMEICLQEMDRNNGVRSETMIIRQNGERAAPVFYLRDIYGQYLQGTPIDALIAQILFISRQKVDTLPVDGEWFESFENVRTHIIFKVVNFERNTQLLETCPFIKKLDLALTFRVLVEESRSQMSSVLINDAMMSAWQISEETLYQLAVENMRHLWQDVLEPVQDMAREMMDDAMEESYDQFLWENPMAQEMPLYVLTNTIRMNGASVLFYTDAVRRFADSVGMDVFILPSSIHEVLLMPVIGEMCAWEMRQIVEEVNHQLVSEEEVLSDHVYRYLYKQKKLIIAA